MFASLSGGYARGPLPGQPDRLGVAEQASLAGTLDQDDYDAVADEFVREIMREQEQAGLGMLTDGGVRRPDRLIALVEGVVGLEPGAPEDLAITPTGERLPRPRVVGQIAWHRPLTVADWEFASAQTELPVKQVLIGPYTMGRLAELGGRHRETTTLELATAINRELRALVEAGCRIVQIDEDALTEIGNDPAEWELFDRAQHALTAELPDPQHLHLALGLCGGAVVSAGFATLFGGPWSSYVVDLLAGPDAWRFVFAAPPTRGIICGASDAHRPAYDEVEVLVWAIAWAASGGRGPERVGIAPNGTLVAMDRHYARRKIERLGEALKIASMGPLQDVADALDPEPLASRMPELRRMAEAVETARRG